MLHGLLILPLCRLVGPVAIGSEGAFAGRSTGLAALATSLVLPVPVVMVFSP